MSKSKDMKYSEVREIVYRRHKGRCAICGQKLSLDEMCISLIVPKSKGGYKDFSNMQCACKCCAVMKNNLTQDEFMRKLWGVTIRNLRNVARAYINILCK